MNDEEVAEIDGNHVKLYIYVADIRFVTMYLFRGVRCKYFTGLNYLVKDYKDVIERTVRITI